MSKGFANQLIPAEVKKRDIHPNINAINEFPHPELVKSYLELRLIPKYLYSIAMLFVDILLIASFTPQVFEP